MEVIGMKIVQWQMLREEGPCEGTTKRPAQGKPSLVITGQTGQEFEGFGCCFNELGWVAMQPMADEEREKLLDDLFLPENGFVFNRLPIGANDYSTRWYSHNEFDSDYAMEHFSVKEDEKYLLPYIRAAYKRNGGMRLFASPWSPPTWMKNPPVYNYGKLIATPENLKAYALYFVKFLQAYEKMGLPIQRLFVQNEVCADQKFPSCLWTGEEYRDFVRDYLGPAFEEHKIDTEIWLGTINCEDFQKHLGVVMLDEKAASYIHGVGYQWAGREAIQRAHASYPQLKIMQTENECGMGSNSFKHAQHVYGLMQHYFLNGASCYVYWNAMLSTGGESTWGWKQNSMISIAPDTGKVTYNPEYYLMRSFARNIKPGARYIKVEGPFAGLSFAFHNPDGSVVLGVHNPYDQEIPFTVEGNELMLPKQSIHTLVFR